MRVLMLIASFLFLFMTGVTAADEPNCILWNETPQAGKVMYVSGYRDGIFMATVIARQALDKPPLPHSEYLAVHEAVFIASNVGELVSRISLYCEANRKDDVMDALNAIAAKEKVKKMRK